MTNEIACRWFAALGVALLLSGCFKDDTADPKNVSELASGAGAGSGSSAPATNGKPTIQGTPTTVIRQGEAYAFQPVASDPDGDTLTFAISGRPTWASFDPATGRLSGTPDAGDVGSYADIRISVSDGKDSAGLSPFAVQVEQIAMGSATLSWTPPTENTDGSTLTNLAGYKVYYGREPGALSQVVNISNPGITTYVIENLSPATWYFAMTSYNSSGVESSKSEPVSKSVS